MWQDESSYAEDSFGYETGVDEFSLFLESVTYSSQLEPSYGPVSLVGALHLWLYRGNGLTICPTYESFMVTLVRIIDDWLKHDRVKVSNSEIWPFDENVQVDLFEDRQLAVESDTRLILQREVFLQLKSTKQNRDRAEMLELLQELRRTVSAIPDSPN
jgi:hypothetical protein